MDFLMELYNNYSMFLFCIMLLFCLILLIMHINQRSKLNKLAKKFEHFMGRKILTENNEVYTIEQMLSVYLNQSKKMTEDNEKLMKTYSYLENRINLCIQKVGIVRYNPYEEMGGNLCFVIALLDNDNTGVLINGIHSRSSSFTYGKPVVKGESSYVLSAEEMQAISAAKENILK